MCSLLMIIELPLSRYEMIKDTSGYGFINNQGEWEGAIRQVMDKVNYMISQGLFLNEFFK